ncbi:SAM-dependent methyltransferase [Nocardia colli]|uniref:SAM-dependent methyltransferase n=1 Tax=Nocardia colli TaxID=2545717 RepID=UPI0035E2B2D5
MNESPTPDLLSVAEFYNNIVALELLMGENLHLGYWSQGPDAWLPEAQDRLTDLVSVSARAGAGMRVLDVGCGTGAPARRVARTTGAHVTGVTISSVQAATAGARSLAANMADRTTFLTGDAMDLPLADASYDAAFAIESLVHMSDKSRAVHEVLRVLRPGGRFVIADVVLLPSQKVVGVDAGDVATFQLLDLQTADKYKDLVRDAGFTVEEVRDCADQTRPTYARCVQRIQQNRSQLVAAAGAERTLALSNLMALFARTRQLGYIMLVAVKN